MLKFLFKFLCGIIIFLVLLVTTTLILGYKNYHGSCEYKKVDTKNLIYEKINDEINLVNSEDKLNLDISLTETDLTNILYSNFVKLNNKTDEVKFNPWIKIDNGYVYLYFQVKTTKYINYYTGSSIKAKINVDEDLNLILSFEKVQIGKISVGKKITKWIISKIKFTENGSIKVNSNSLVMDLKPYIKEVIDEEYVNLVKDAKLLDFSVTDSLNLVVKLEKLTSQTASNLDYLASDKIEDFKIEYKNEIAKYLLEVMVNDEANLKLDERKFNQLLYFGLIKDNLINKSINIGNTSHNLKLETMYFNFFENNQKLNIVITFDNIKFLIVADTSISLDTLDNTKYLKIVINKVTVKDIELTPKQFLDLLTKLNIEMFSITSNSLNFAYDKFNEILSNNATINTITYKNTLNISLNFAQQSAITTLVGNVKDNLEVASSNIENETLKLKLNDLAKKISNNENYQEEVNDIITVINELTEEEQTELTNYLLQNVDEKTLDLAFKMLGGN